MDDKKSLTTLVVLLLVSSVLLLILFICRAMYVIKLPPLQIIWLFSSSHPILALNLLILLIIVSSRCFAISRNNNSVDQFMLLTDSPDSQDAADSIAEARAKKKGTLESTWKKTKEGSHLRQLKHSRITTEDGVRPADQQLRSNDEVTSSGSSSLSSAKLRKEVSLTKEEVNRRVERFIRKFNDD